MSVKLYLEKPQHFNKWFPQSLPKSLFMATPHVFSVGKKSFKDPYGANNNRLKKHTFVLGADRKPCMLAAHFLKNEFPVPGSSLLYHIPANVRPENSATKQINITNAAMFLFALSFRSRIRRTALT